MSIATEKMPRCDVCFETGTAFASHSIRTARREAKRAGWAFTDGKDYCPTCAGKCARKSVGRKSQQEKN